jgi:hypothetical protein
MTKKMFASPLLVLLLATTTPAFAGDAPGALAMMDMMPMGGAAAPAMPSPPAAPMGGSMEDDKMRMGGGMPAQGQGQMPMGQPAMPAQPMAGCPMMGMMQNSMRPGMSPMQGMAAQGGMAPMQGAATGMESMEQFGSSSARLEGRIAFLRAELKISGADAPAWETFASSLRTGRDHLDAARAALQESGRAIDPMVRLESYESHLKARTEAMRTTRMAFTALYAQLNDQQKRVATTMLPVIGAF